MHCPRELTFRVIAESLPGAGWEDLYQRSWHAYRAWYLRDGDAARPSFVAARAKLREYLPRLVGAWETMVDAAGGGDLCARMLTMYDTPALVRGCRPDSRPGYRSGAARGCSQVALSGPEPVLVRNYDFHPDEFEAVAWASQLTGRRVLGVSDCLWGLLDGINDAGLTVSLAFGGVPEVAPGFAIPIVVRYLLETCETTDDAVTALGAVPVQMAYNLTIVDAAGHSTTVFVGPGRVARARRLAVAANHQERVGWPEHAGAVASVAREHRLRQLVAQPGVDESALVDAFLAPPLYTTSYERRFGTLYTAVYRPRQREAEYLWPDSAWMQPLDAPAPGQRTVALAAKLDAVAR